MKAEPTLTSIGGIHHVTSIAADPKRTEEFYAGTLGLHLVRKTVNFDEPSVLHFYFGDPRGSPGSMITFFVHETERPGRCGTGYVNSIVFAVPPGTLQSWRGRLIARGADVTGTAWSFGEECVCFRDPDGLELALPPMQARAITTRRGRPINRSDGSDPSKFKPKVFSTRRNF
jgi:glyoxalase family protein